MFRTLALVVTLASVAPLAACSDGDAGPSDAGSTERDEAFWGLGDRRCLDFKSSGQNTYQIDMFLDPESVQKGKTNVYVLRFKLNGSIYRTEKLERTGFDVLLQSRDVGPRFGEPGQFLAFTPAPVFVRDPIAIGDEVSTTTTASVSSAGQPAVAKAYTVAVSALSEDEFDVMGTLTKSTKYTFSLTPEGGSPIVDRIWFAPNIGIVRYDHTGADYEEVTLSKVRTLAPGAQCVIE